MFFNEDRREYARIATNIDCLLYIDSNEISGKIKNLSENGLLIETTNFSKLSNIAQLIFMDDNEVINQKIRIVRQDNNKLGCYVHCSINDSFYKYVILKKARKFSNRNSTK